MPGKPVKPRARERLLWMLQTAAALLIVWLALDGTATLWVGAIFSVLGAAAGAWLVPGEIYPWRPLRLLLFFLYFVRDSILGGMDVAWRAFMPRLPIQPGLVELKLWLPPGLPRTVLIAVVSLVPGTLSAELADDTLHVHALTPGASRSLPALQRRVGRLFSIEPPEET
jgi:multicomponent Na+:H+ antiporter subunit E